MKYEVIIIWYTGEKDTYFYNTENEAIECINNMKMAFGNQITFTCINRR